MEEKILFTEICHTSNYKLQKSIENVQTLLT